MSRRIYNLNDNYFDIIDTQEKAYLLGLLFTDGTNYTDLHRIKLDAAEDSKEILTYLKKEINYEGDIKSYPSQIKIINKKQVLTQPIHRLSFTSKPISERLKQLGMDSNKKYRKFPKEVPESLLNHFIRGLIDGDGSISFWIDNKRTNHKKFCLNFCCTSDIVYTICNIFSTKFNCNPAISDRRPESDNNNLQFIQCGNKMIQSILDWIYQDATLYIQRKYEKYLILKEENIRNDNDNTLYGSAIPRKKVINILTQEIFESVTKAAKSVQKSVGYITTHCRKKDTEFRYYDEYLLSAN